MDEIATLPPHDADDACSLTPERLTERLALWSSLAREALSRSSGPSTITTTYPRGVRPRLEALIAAEAECCPSLNFGVRARGDVLEVELRFPPELASLVAAATEDGGTGSTVASVN